MNYPHWIAHFRANKANRPEPAWQAPFQMPEKKRHLLAVSLAEYQLGDGGGECCLVAADAEQYRGSLEDIRTVVDLWFAEEREHSRLLSGAVERVGGTFVTETFAFRLFYAIRRRLGVQFEMLVLLVVEIVSTGYYRVIRRHVGDRPIEDMCRLILRDETGHIQFHRARLAARYPRGVAWWWQMGFHLLGQACVTFLWLGHGRALRAIGGTRREMFHHVQRGMEKFLRQLAESVMSNAAAGGGAAVADEVSQPVVAGGQGPGVAEGKGPVVAGVFDPGKAAAQPPLQAQAAR